jgi:uncharacterized protein (TIGR01777 family)
MNVLVTGASGFIGTAVVSRLESGGHSVEALRRTATVTGPVPVWNPAAGEINLQSAEPFDAVVHLAGESIAQRWTAAARQRIRFSRADATRLLCEALARLPHPPQVLVCASATGFYGDRAGEMLDEQSPAGIGFLAEVCQAWEAAAEPARRSGIRVVHLRFGIVLARHGGALARMLPAFWLGLGGRLGTGRQFWSWITLDDLMGVVERVMQDDALSGPVNTVAPNVVTNAEFTSALARALHRPAFLPVPGFVVKTIFDGIGREALLGSQRVHPARLVGAGFKFQFPEISAAFQHLLAGPIAEAREGRG